MRTYSNVLRDLCDILEDATKLSDPNDSTAHRLEKINTKNLIALCKDSESNGKASLSKALMRLLMVADESGDHRRSILATKNEGLTKETYHTSKRDIVGSFCVNSAISFLFVDPNSKFIHCLFIIENESKKVIRVSFNETVYNPADPAMIGTICVLNDLARGHKSLVEYK